MKSMLKEHMILKNQVTHVKAERDVMAEADDPWIVKLMYSFQVFYTIPGTYLVLYVYKVPLRDVVDLKRGSTAVPKIWVSYMCVCTHTCWYVIFYIGRESVVLIRCPGEHRTHT